MAHGSITRYKSLSKDSPRESNEKSAELNGDLMRTDRILQIKVGTAYLPDCRKSLEKEWRQVPPKKTETIGCDARRIPVVREAQHFESGQIFAPPEGCI